MNAQLGDAIADRLNISNQTKFKALDPGDDYAAYRRILQVVDPDGKFWQRPDREQELIVIER